jgi:hypothetical protein
MCEAKRAIGTNDDASQNADGRVALLENRVRYLEDMLLRHDPHGMFDLDRLLNGPQRKLTSQEIDIETERLLTICAEQGVSKIVAEVATCRDLLLSLARACHQSNLTAAFQYLNYLASPYD